jgi:hypothetical protein
MGEVIQFVNFDQSTGEMTITPEAMSFLASLPTHIKIAPLAIVGPLSSGKSFFCNNLT